MDKVPLQVGLGTSGLGIKPGDTENDPQECVRIVETALDLGYRHIDTAQMYGNEHLVGEGIERADVARNNVFLATKVDIGNLGYDEVLESTRESLDRLGTDYIDLLYVHWPVRDYEPERTLPAFDVLKDEGVIEHVGVSNFTVDVLETARTVLDSPIAANQFQIHPMLPPTKGERAELLPYCDEHDIDLVAWSPLVHGEALELPEIKQVAGKYDASPAQVILRWLLEYDVKPIVKSTDRRHLRENLEAAGLEIDKSDIDLIESIDRRKRLFDRGDAPWNQKG